IRILNYPNNYDPFTTRLLNTPLISIDQKRGDRVESVIQDNLKHSQYIAFGHLEEDLFQSTLAFKLHVYSKPKTKSTVISEPIDLSPNIQKNILTAVERSLQKFSSLAIQLTSTTAQASTPTPTQLTSVASVTHKTYEDIYDYILTNDLL
ncbi:hypothetical protein MHK_003815, partial [Candidatus Magnetomorum sp. HK-1]